MAGRWESPRRWKKIKNTSCCVSYCNTPGTNGKATMLHVLLQDAKLHKIRSKLFYLITNLTCYEFNMVATFLQLFYIE